MVNQPKIVSTIGNMHWDMGIFLSKAFLSHQSSVISHSYRSWISHQSSVISHQSSVLSHQSSVLSHQSSVISHQSSVISSHQALVISHHSSSIRRQSSVFSHRLSVVGHRFETIWGVQNRFCASFPADGCVCVWGGGAFDAKSDYLCADLTFLCAR
jgi:hypothetical protein